MASSRRVSSSRTAAVVSPKESPLAWLRSRKDKDGQPLISDAEFAAGERLRADYTFAQLGPRITADWSLLLTSGGGRHARADHSADISDAVAAAQERVRRALIAAGPELSGLLLDVCCHLQGLERVEERQAWPKRSGKYFLRIALRQLARHYGILSDHDPRAAAPRAINHWGAEGYKPESGRSEV